MHRVAILPFQHQCQLSRQCSTRIVQSCWRELNKTFVQRRYLNQDTNAAGVWDPFPDPFQPIVEKSAETALDEDHAQPKKPHKSQQRQQTQQSKFEALLSPRVMDAVLTTVMGLAAVGIGGTAYHAWYEWSEVHKVYKAFTEPSPTLKSRIKRGYFHRDEQRRIDRAIAGHSDGKYYLLMGERGTGKTQLVLNAMDKVGHYGIVFCEAHSDSEVFKARLGRALNYLYREDYVGQLFAREAPERGSALLDIEKALNVVEHVAFKYHRRRGRPLVLVINNIHAFGEDEEGVDLLEILRQRAEAWAATRLVTMVFNTDDYSVYERLKRDAARMEVVRIEDLELKDAVKFLKDKRHNKEPDEVYEQYVKERVGGRLAFLNRLAKANDLQVMIKIIEHEERTWIINTIGLIPDFEESEFDNQKYAAAAWKLIRAIVDSPTKSIPLNECRIITGNSSFHRRLDHDNIIVIDNDNNVTADSKMLMNIFEEIVNSEGFDDLLKNVISRIEEVDKEQRTREIVWSSKNNQVVKFGMDQTKARSIFW